jgi:enamine deaminase RidA (YjgF/YER057c/UK114 family)
MGYRLEPTEGAPMSVQLTSPDGLFQPVPYHHVAVATGSRRIEVAGQIARSAAGEHLATGDLAGQVAHVLRNTATALGGVGATFHDVVRLTFYVTAWTPEQWADVERGIESVRAELDLPSPLPPASLIGVDYLFEPDVRIELLASAVLD